MDRKKLPRERTEGFGFHWNNTRHLLEGDVFSPPFIAENREVRSYADVEHYFNEFGY